MRKISIRIREQKLKCLDYKTTKNNNNNNIIIKIDLNKIFIFKCTTLTFCYVFRVLISPDTSELIEFATTQSLTAESRAAQKRKLISSRVVLFSMWKRLWKYFKVFYSLRSFDIGNNYYLATNLNCLKKSRIKKKIKK